jgi:hypothetical protein
VTTLEVALDLIHHLSVQAGPRRSNPADGGMACCHRVYLVLQRVELGAYPPPPAIANRLAKVVTSVSWID